MSETKIAPFVRDAMLPEQAPPVAQRGVVKWIRENLMSSWLNGILTLLSIYVIYFAISHTLPWFLNGIWSAGSLSECRAIRDELMGPDASSACFAVISDRWHQLLFGFYPQDAYWRPTATILLFLVAVAPILFPAVPRKVLWFSAAYPFLAYFLLWGETIWGPLAVAGGFVLGYYVLHFVSRSAGTIAGTIAAIVVPVLYWLFLVGPIDGVLDSIAPIGLPFVSSEKIGGFTLSIVIGLTGILLSLPLGILLALGRQSDLFIINKVSVAFIEVFRGVPLIVWLFTAHLLLNYFLPPGTSFDALLRVMVLVTLFSAAYIAEVVRGGLAALPRGQYEAADSLGLNYWKAQQLIIMPQALKISIPGIVNTFIGLFKDTTLVIFIGLQDPLGFSQLIRSDTDWNGIYWELFVFIGLMFFICCFSMSRYSQYLERTLRTDHR